MQIVSYALRFSKSYLSAAEDLESLHYFKIALFDPNVSLGIGGKAA